jgi:hypothetical protein
LNAPFAELVPLSKISIADEMREELRESEIDAWIQDCAKERHAARAAQPQWGGCMSAGTGQGARRLLQDAMTLAQSADRTASGRSLFGQFLIPEFVPMQGLVLLTAILVRLAQRDSVSGSGLRARTAATRGSVFANFQSRRVGHRYVQREDQFAGIPAAHSN